MNSSIPHITRSNSPSSLARPPGKGNSKAFAQAIVTEQAATLMQKAGLGAQWELIRQNNDNRIVEISDLILKREAIAQSNMVSSRDVQLSFNDVTYKLREAGLPLPLVSELESQKNVSSTHPAFNLTPLGRGNSDSIYTTPTNVSPDNSLVSEENLLILSLQNNEMGIRKTIFAYGDNRVTLLPLNDIMQSLDFEVAVDGENGTAKGWFISENRDFALDTANSTVTIAGKEIPYDSSLVTVAEGEVFVDAQLLSNWFPVDFNVARGELLVSVEPREKLPIQVRLEREQKWSKLSNKRDLELQYPLEANEYGAFSFPVIDVSLGGGVATDQVDGTYPRSSYSVVAEGELAYMGAKLFMSGNEADLYDNARISLERQDPNGQLLGPLKAKEIAVGDVTPVGIPILSGLSSERGVSISNKDLLRSTDFNTTRFEGNMPPGWDVELYLNGNLLEVQRVSTDGRYIFDDIPVYFGSNSFKVLAYGPQGQERVADEQEINVGTTMLAPGKTEYSLSATQRKSSVLGVNEQNYVGDQSVRLNGRFSLGLNKYLSANSGVTSVEFNDSRHNYLLAGVSTSLASSYSAANFIFDTAGGSGMSLQGQTSLGEVNLKATHDRSSDLITESNPNNTLESKTTIGLNGSTDRHGLLPPLYSTLSAIHSSYDNGDDGLLRGQVSGYALGLHMSNMVDWNYARRNETDTEIDGRFQATGTLGQSRLTGTLEYDLGEGAEITSYGLSSSMRLSRDLSANASVINYNGDNQRTAAKAGLNWDIGPAILSPSVDYSTNTGFGGFLTLSFSLGGNPVTNSPIIQSEKRSGTGTATALVYHDQNNNREFDDGDTPLPEVEVVARQSLRKSETNDDGVAVFTGLSSYKPTDVEIINDTLEDPFWEPSIKGTAITPRSGSVNRIEFPVVSTGEIDGTVYLQSGSGSQKTLSGVTIEIVDKEGVVVQTTTSEYDGFYLLEKVFPGSYILRIKPDEGLQGVDTSSIQMEIHIGNDGTIANGNDLILLEPPANPKELDHLDKILTQAREQSPQTESITAIASTSSSKINVNPLEVRGGVGIGSQQNSQMTSATGQQEQSKTAFRISPLQVKFEGEKPVAGTPVDSAIQINPLNIQENLQSISRTGEKSEYNLAPQSIVEIKAKESKRIFDQAKPPETTIRIRPLVAGDKEGSSAPYPQVQSLRANNKGFTTENSTSSPVVHLSAVENKRILRPELVPNSSVRIRSLAKKNSNIVSQAPVVIEADSKKRILEQNNANRLVERRNLDQSEQRELIDRARLEHALEKHRVERMSSKNDQVASQSGGQSNFQPVIQPIDQPIGKIITPIELNLGMEASYQNQLMAVSTPHLQTKRANTVTQQYAAIEQLGKKYI